MAPRSFSTMIALGALVLCAAVPATALAGAPPSDGDTSTTPPPAQVDDSDTGGAKGEGDTDTTPPTPDTSGTPSDDQYTKGGGDDCTSGEDCTPPTCESTGTCEPPVDTCTDPNGCDHDHETPDCDSDSVTGGGQSTTCNPPTTTTSGGGGTPVAGQSQPGATGGGELPFTGLPIAWVIALGSAMMLGGMSFIYRARWRASIANRRGR